MRVIINGLIQLNLRKISHIRGEEHLITVGSDGKRKAVTPYEESGLSFQEFLDDTFLWEFFKARESKYWFKKLA